MKISVLIFVFISLSLNLNARDLFESNYYDVEFISNNIENDKITKINEIKKKSILKILNDSLYLDEFNDIKNLLTEDFINTLIQNVIIDDEIIINDKYYSKIKINFDKKKIIKFYRKKNIPYVEYHPEKFLLIIYEQNQLNHNLFTPNNNFYSYFINNLQEKTLFKIPNLDINDRYILKVEDINNKNLVKIKKFSNKYNLNEIIIVIAKINNNNVSYEIFLYSDNKTSEKKLKFNEYQFKKFYFILENETLNIWKKLNQIQNNYLNLINCKVNYFNILELKEIKKNLNNISLIENINIKSLSNRSIEYDIYFYGNLQILKNIFKFNKLDISITENICKIRLK